MILEIKARDLDASDRAKINQFRLLKEMKLILKHRKPFHLKQNSMKDKQ